MKLDKITNVGLKGFYNTNIFEGIPSKSFWQDANF